MSTSEGKCVLVEVGALISSCIYSYRIVMLLVPYMWASMTFLAKNPLLVNQTIFHGISKLLNANTSLRSTNFDSLFFYHSHSRALCFTTYFPTAITTENY